MPRSGGESDKLGNLFEAVWTVNCTLDVLLGRYRSITVEAFTDDSLGVEFHIDQNNGVRQFHSAKRQTQGGDWSVAKLTRKDESGRSILGDLIAKLQSRPNSKLVFVSQTGANTLRELCERAANASSVIEFKKLLAGKLLKEFDDRIVPICADEQGALQALKAIEVVPRAHDDLVRDLERRISGDFYALDGSDLDAGDFRRALAEYILDNLGPMIDTDQLKPFLTSKNVGFRDWKHDQSMLERVATHNAAFISIAETELINSQQITRNETAQIVDVVKQAKSRGALLVASGGYGKSCVIVQTIKILQAQNHPVLCIRLDSVESCNTTQQLGQQFDFPVSPAVLLAGIADGEPCSLVIDQLDAVSIVSGRNADLWNVFKLLCDEVASYPNMNVVLACRDFDLSNDYRLRMLDDDKSGFTKIPLANLTKAYIDSSLEQAVGDSVFLTEKQYQILGVPFHLLLFLAGDPTKGFESIGELYERYCERKRQNLYSRLGREAKWNEVLGALANRMSNDRKLFAPKIVVDESKADARAMASEHVLVDTGNKYRFFHESFFDYAYASDFCRTGQSLVTFLESTEQHLFRRSQVRQILAYRREHDPDQYLVDLSEILASEKVRFHIRRMVASGLGEVSDPRPKEWEAIKPFFFDGDISRYIRMALRSRVGWFDRLDQQGQIDEWLTKGDEDSLNLAFWYMEQDEVHKQRSKRVAEIILPYSKIDDPAWISQIKRVFNWGKPWKSKEMTSIFFDLVSRGCYDDTIDDANPNPDNLWDVQHDAGKESPKFVIDLLAIWFPRMVDQFDDGENWHILKECVSNRCSGGITALSDAANADPAYFVEKILPLAVELIQNKGVDHGDEITNRIWPWLSNSTSPFNMDEAILLFLRQSLGWMAANEPDSFRERVATFSHLNDRTFAYLLLRTWMENPQEFADDCAEYLSESPIRFCVGYSSWSGGGEGTGHAAVSRMAIEAISPHCSDERFSQMEDAVIGYCNDYEKKTREARGFRELIVLRSFDASRTSNKLKARILELEGKYPNVDLGIVAEDSSTLLSAARSPISEDAMKLMTDDQWISAMQKYDGTKDRFHGNYVELSRALSRFAQLDKPRFAKLALKMPTDAHPYYFDAILDGLCDKFLSVSQDQREAVDKAFAEVPLELFKSTIHRLHALPDRPCGKSIIDCIEKLSNRKLPDQLLEALVYYATNDPDPKEDIWKQKPPGSTSNYDGGSPYQQGINCVRGRAACAIGRLLYADESRHALLIPAIESVVNDDIIAVRTCGIQALMPVLNFDRNKAVDRFTQASSGHLEIYATNPFERFAHFAVYSHYDKIREMLQQAIASENESAIQNAARQTILADLADVDVGEDAVAIRSGSDLLRKTAVSVYAHNIGDKEVGGKCAEHLEAFLDDDSEEVRKQLSDTFFNINDERLLELEAFIGRFIESKSFETGADQVLRALEKSRLQLPTIICRAVERVLEFADKANQNKHYSPLRHVATLVVRQYEQTVDQNTKTLCLNLIDRMEQIGHDGMAGELGKLER